MYYKWVRLLDIAHIKLLFPSITFASSDLFLDLGGQMKTFIIMKTCIHYDENINFR